MVKGIIWQMEKQGKPALAAILTFFFVAPARCLDGGGCFVAPDSVIFDFRRPNL